MIGDNVAKILLSAFSCDPYMGSEAGIGWNWAIEARKLGHDVWVLTSPIHQRSTEKFRDSDALAASIHWSFPQSPCWPLSPGEQVRKQRSYNTFWQIAAFLHARRLHKHVQFDIVHHVTWGGVRVPSYLGLLGIPFIYGPVGGGETSPKNLRADYSPRGRFIDFGRDLLNAVIFLNPFTRVAHATAAVILTKTADSKAVIPKRYRGKTLIFSELGIAESEIAAEPIKFRGNSPRLLFVGRFVEWKGGSLALRIFQALKCRCPTARITLIGSGPAEGRLRRRIADFGLEGSAEILSWVPREALKNSYRDYDLLLFPSLHDSSGNVVLEALASGLPVACLDVGGPKEIATSECGIILQTGGLDPREFAERAARRLALLLENEVAMRAMSAAALQRAKKYIWSKRVASLYSGVVGNQLSDVSERPLLDIVGGADQMWE